MRPMSLEFAPFLCHAHLSPLTPSCSLLAQLNAGRAVGEGCEQLWSQTNKVSKTGRYQGMDNRRRSFDIALSRITEDKQWALAGIISDGYKRVLAKLEELGEELRHLTQAARDDGVDDLPGAVAALVVAEASSPVLSARARFLLYDAQHRAMQGPSETPMALATLLPTSVATALINVSKDPKQRLKVAEARMRARAEIAELRALGAEPNLQAEVWQAAALELREYHMRECEAKVEEGLVKINLKQRHKRLDTNTSTAATAITKLNK